MGDGITITISAATEDAASRLQAFFGSFEGGINKLLSFGPMLAELGTGLAAAFSVRGLVEFAEKTAEAEEAIGRLVQKTGLAVETLSALQRVAYVIGEPVETMSMALGMFSDKVFVASRTGGQAAQAFKDLKIALTDAGGAVRPVDDLLGDVADRFAAMPDGPMKAAAATELFGRAGRELIPILNQGRDGLAAMKAQEGGISAEDIRRANEFGEATRKLAMQVQAAARYFINDLLPALTSVVNQVAGATDWFEVLSVLLGVVGIAVKTLASTLLLTILSFEVLGITLGKVGATLVAVVTGDFRTAKQIIQDLGTEVRKTIDETEARLKNIWDPEAPAETKPTPAPAPQEFSATSKAKIQQEESEAALKILHAELGAREAEQKAAFDKGLLTLSEYTAKRKEILQAGMDAEAKLFEAQYIYLNEQISLAPAGSDEKAELQSKQLKLVAEEREKEQAFNTAMLQLDADRAQKEKASIEEVQRAYATATQSKLALLDQEEKSAKEKIDKTVADHEAGEKAKMEISATYAAKRKEIASQEADAQNAIALAQIQGRRQLLETDPNKTEEEKKADLLAMLRQENELLQKNIALNETRAKDAALSDEARLQAEKRLEELNQSKALNERSQQQTSAKGTFGGEFQTTLTGLKGQWGSWAAQMAGSFKNVFNSAISSISNGITGLIMGTETWGRALRQIGTSILTSIVESIVQMGVRWMLTQALMAVFGKSLMAAQVAATAGLAVTTTALWAVPASLSTIATNGGSAAAAPAEILMANAATMAGSLAMFDAGGFTGPGARGEPAGIVHRGEYVFSAPAVDRIGVGNLDAMHSAAGSGTSSGGSGPVNLSVHYWDDKNAMADHIRNNPDVHHAIVDVVNRNRGRIVSRKT